MAYDLYQSAALTLRYCFAAAGAFIVGRSVYMTIRDGKRQSSVRAHIRETGVLALLIVSCPNGETRRFPLNIEGSVGDGRVCDMRIPGAGLKRRHFFYEIVNGCLTVTAVGASELYEADGNQKKKITLAPAGVFRAGNAVFRFIMLKAKQKPLSPITKRAYGKSIGIVLSRSPVRKSVRRKVRRYVEDDA